MSKLVKWVVLDGFITFNLWVLIYYFLNGELPGYQRGVVCLVALLVFFQWLLGSYSFLSLGKPEVWNRFQILVVSFAASMAIFVSFYLTTDLFYDSSHIKRVILPLAISSFFSVLLLSALVRFQHMLTAQSRWLLITNRKERDLIAREITSTGMVIPAALEWRSSSIETSIPRQLADL